MEPGKLIEFLGILEKLKCNTRHNWTTSGRRESVAEHSWRLAVMAFLLKDEFPELDMDRVVDMCLIHDWGEAVTGDIPAFIKGSTDEKTESAVLRIMTGSLPEDLARRLNGLFDEMEALQTKEAKLTKALDKIETLIQHNEAGADTWLPLEYELNLTYGNEISNMSEYTRRLRDLVRQESERIISEKPLKDQECGSTGSHSALDDETFEKIKELRKELHEIPELSGQERKTMEVLKMFLRKHTSLSVNDRGSWFYAIHQEDGAGETVVFRADMDAIKGAGNIPYHGCGHDGHSAILAGLCLLTEGRVFQKNLCFLFQPAEETGEGGKICCNLLEELGADRVYGFHNLPGYPLGTAVMRRETFSCASRGLIIRLTGKPCHAAYPEQGINPAYLISGIIASLPDFLKPEEYQGMVLASIIEVKVGDESFGVSAGDGTLALTIRAEHLEDLDKLEGRIRDEAESKAEAEHMACCITRRDEFPDTVNTAEIADKIRMLFEKEGIPCLEAAAPFRWSEDFGWYLKKSQGMYFGMGAGEDCPDLHTPDYEFPDELIRNAVRCLYLLAEI